MRSRAAEGTPGANLAAGAQQPVARLASSGQDAAGELFTACYPRLAGWVRRLVGTDEDAHDIAAESFARLLGRWSRVDNPPGYLYMIAANLVSDHWRKTGREQRAIRRLTDAAAWNRVRCEQQAHNPPATLSRHAAAERGILRYLGPCHRAEQMILCCLRGLCGRSGSAAQACRWRPDRVQVDGRGSGFMVWLFDGADSFRLIIWLSAVVFPVTGGER